MVKRKKENSHLYSNSNNSLFQKSKRSQGDLIATILLILLVIVAAGILIAFLVPYVKDLLSSSDCYEYNGKIQIISDPAYTCYDQNAKALYLKVAFGDLDSDSKNEVTGLDFMTQTNMISNNYEMIPPNSTPPGVSLLTGDIGELPSKNQERTYKISNISIKPNLTIVYPIINKNKKCTDVSNSINSIPKCNLNKLFMSVNNTEDEFISGGIIPSSYIFNISIINTPPLTKSLAIIIDDINDPGNQHGAYFSIPPLSFINLSNLLNQPGQGYLLNVPHGESHYYKFTVYAINTPTLSPPFPYTKANVLSVMDKTNTITHATIYGIYKG